MNKRKRKKLNKKNEWIVIKDKKSPFKAIKFNYENVGKPAHCIVSLKDSNDEDDLLEVKNMSYISIKSPALKSEE